MTPKRMTQKVVDHFKTLQLNQLSRITVELKEESKVLIRVCEENKVSPLDLVEWLLIPPTGEERETLSCREETLSKHQVTWDVLLYDRIIPSVVLSQSYSSQLLAEGLCRVSMYHEGRLQMFVERLRRWESWILQYAGEWMRIRQIRSALEMNDDEDGEAAKALAPKKIDDWYKRMQTEPFRPREEGADHWQQHTMTILDELRQLRRTAAKPGKIMEYVHHQVSGLALPEDLRDDHALQWLLAIVQKNSGELTTHMRNLLRIKHVLDPVEPILPCLEQWSPGLMEKMREDLIKFDQYRTTLAAFRERIPLENHADPLLFVRTCQQVAGAQPVFSYLMQDASPSSVRSMALAQLSGYSVREWLLETADTPARTEQLYALLRHWWEQSDQWEDVISSFAKEWNENSAGVSEQQALLAGKQKEWLLLWTPQRLERRLRRDAVPISEWHAALLGFLREDWAKDREQDGRLCEAYTQYFEYLYQHRTGKELLQECMVKDFSLLQRYVHHGGKDRHIMGWVGREQVQRLLVGYLTFQLQEGKDLDFERLTELGPFLTGENLDTIIREALLAGLAPHRLAQLAESWDYEWIGWNERAEPLSSDELERIVVEHPEWVEYETELPLMNGLTLSYQLVSPGIKEKYSTRLLSRAVIRAEIQNEDVLQQMFQELKMI